MRRLALALFATAAFTLVASCQGSSGVATATKPSASPSGSGAESSVTFAQTYGITGVVHGFSGDHKQFTEADAAKMTAAVRDGEGAVIKSSAVALGKSGAFTVPNLATGAYFVVVTLPDGTSWESVLRTDSAGDNFVSAGTTLACAWAHDQLNKKLVFVAELPYGQMLVAGAKLDAALEADNTALAGAAGQLSQLEQLEQDAANGIQTLLDAASTALDRRATANTDTRPPYAAQADYDAKKKALGVK